MAAASGRYYLFLNADAWLTAGSLDRLVAFADAHPQAAVLGPRLLNPDGRCSARCAASRRCGGSRPSTCSCASSRRARGSSTRSTAAASARRGPRRRGRDGRVLLVRREAVEEVGPLDEAFFLFSEETDWCKRFSRRGLDGRVLPGRGGVHVGGAAHGGRMFRENVRGHLRYLAKHRGVRYAERARRLLRLALALRGRSSAASAAACTATRRAGSARAACRRCWSDDAASARARDRRRSSSPAPSSARALGLRGARRRSPGRSRSSSARSR